MQALWQAVTGWDETIPEEHIVPWRAWSKDLSLITSHQIVQPYDTAYSPIISHPLHAFSDASTRGYGAIIYLLMVHADTSTTTSLVASQTRVTPS